MSSLHNANWRGPYPPLPDMGDPLARRLITFYCRCGDSLEAEGTNSVLSYAQAMWDKMHSRKGCAPCDKAACKTGHRGQHETGRVMDAEERAAAA